MRVECDNQLFESNLDNVRHDAVVSTAVVHILQQIGIGFKDLDAYAVVTGGGSWTGNRVGVAAIKAYAMVHPKPIIVLKPNQGMKEAIANFKKKQFIPYENVEPSYDSEFVVTVK